MPFEILEVTDRELATPRFTSECTAAYIATIRNFIADGVVDHLAKIRKTHGMFEALQRNDEWDADTDLSLGATSMQSFSELSPFLITSAGADRAIVDNMAKVTKSQLLQFLHFCWVKYVKARIEPGTWLGIHYLSTVTNRL